MNGHVRTSCHRHGNCCIQIHYRSSFTDTHLKGRLIAMFILRRLVQFNKRTKKKIHDRLMKRGRKRTSHLSFIMSVRQKKRENGRHKRISIFSLTRLHSNTRTNRVLWSRRCSYFIWFWTNENDTTIHFISTIRRTIIISCTHTLTMLPLTWVNRELILRMSIVTLVLSPSLYLRLRDRSVLPKFHALLLRRPRTYILSAKAKYAKT